MEVALVFLVVSSTFILLFLDKLIEYFLPNNALSASEREEGRVLNEIECANAPFKKE